jgi:hypothetical protein
MPKAVSKRHKDGKNIHAVGDREVDIPPDAEDEIVFLLHDGHTAYTKKEEALLSRS